MVYYTGRRGELVHPPERKLLVYVGPKYINSLGKSPDQSVIFIFNSQTLPLHPADRWAAAAGSKQNCAVGTWSRLACRPE